MDWDDAPENVDLELRAARLKRAKVLVERGRFTIGRGSQGRAGGRGLGRSGRSRGNSPLAIVERSEKEKAKTVWQPRSARALELERRTQNIQSEILTGLADDAVERPQLPLVPAADYETLGDLGKGQFGLVTKARRKHCNENKIVARKQLLFDFDREGFPLEALREITLLSSLRHPNIVSMQAVAYSNTLSEWYLLMEPAGHELTTLIKGARRRPFRESQIKHLILQLLRALSALHSAWVMHRDLKPPNILVDEHGVLRLCDFGLARRVSCGPELFEYERSREHSLIDSLYKELGINNYNDYIQNTSRLNTDNCISSHTTTTKPLSPTSLPSPYSTHTPNVISGHYRPPEVLLGSRDYGRSVDIWSAGCIFAELLSRSVLFAGKDEPDQLRQIFTILGEPTDSDWPLYSRLAQARGFKYKLSTLPDLQHRALSMGGSDMLRRRFPANGFDGIHQPITSMAFVTPFTHLTTALSNTGFALLTRLLEHNPDKRITADAAKRDRWFNSRPAPEALQSEDIQPLLQLATIADIAGSQTGAIPVPQFATTGFSSVAAPSFILLAQQAGNTAVSLGTLSTLPTAASAGRPPDKDASAMAIAQARAVAHAASTAAAQQKRNSASSYS